MGACGGLLTQVQHGNGQDGRTARERETERQKERDGEKREGWREDETGMRDELDQLL